jgi:hypothetical protein
MAPDLFEQHGRILAAAEAFLGALQRDPGLDMAQINRQRAKLSGLIREHRMAEEALIHQPMRAHGGKGPLGHLEPVMQALLREKLAYSDHVRRWTPQAIDGDRPGYIAAVVNRVHRLRQVIRDEEERLYPTVLRVTGGRGPGARD